MKSILSFVASMVIFGTIGGIVRFINLPSSEIALIRGLLGVLCLLPVLLFTTRKEVLRDLWSNAPVLLLSGIALAGNWILLFEAYRNTTIALAALSYYSAPVIVMILSPFVLKEKISPLKAVCIGITLVGMVLVGRVDQNLNDPHNSFVGVMFGFSAAVCYAPLMLLNKFIKHRGGLETTVPQLFISALVLLPYVLLSGAMKPLSQFDVSLLLLIILGLVHTGLGFLLFFIGLKGLQAQKTAILSYLDPLTSIVISLFIFGEHMTLTQLMGAVLICGGTLAGTLQWERAEGRVK
jgi:drug/metabolite transporter (DMT)-like permease